MRTTCRWQTGRTGAGKTLNVLVRKHVIAIGSRRANSPSRPSIARRCVQNEAGYTCAVDSGAGCRMLAAEGESIYGHSADRSGLGDANVRFRPKGDTRRLATDTKLTFLTLRRFSEHNCSLGEAESALARLIYMLSFRVVLSLFTGKGVVCPCTMPCELRLILGEPRAPPRARTS